ncbi:hypothetical protein N665_0229s0064 [Sinapis alba]|nr:hypothetical protein N665_0229s0064 [Sinapis alba]
MSEMSRTKGFIFQHHLLELSLHIVFLTLSEASSPFDWSASTVSDNNESETFKPPTKNCGTKKTRNYPIKKSGSGCLEVGRN